MRNCCTTLRSILCCLLLLGLTQSLAAPLSVFGQTPLNLPLPGIEQDQDDDKQVEEEEDQRGSLKEWRSSAQQRLKEVAARIKEAEEGEETQPTAKQKQQEELLSWLDLTLSQLGDEREKAHQLAEYLKTEQEQLDKFLQEGLSAKEDSFVDLDRAQDELATEQKRLRRVENRVKASTESFESARQEQQERASARRQAREAVETNTDDKRRQALGDALAEAELMCEIAQATAQLREQELNNAKTSHEAQRAHVKMLRDKVARLREVARFGEIELENLFDELEKRENTLEIEIARAIEAENEVKILEGLWLKAQQQIDSSQGDKDVLTAEVNGYKIRSRALRERTTLLRQQLELFPAFQAFGNDGNRFFRATPRARKPANGPTMQRKLSRSWRARNRRLCWILRISSRNWSKYARS